MRSSPGCSWQEGIAALRGAYDRPQHARGLEALWAPALGVGSLNTSASTLPDVVRRRDATAVGSLSYQRTPVGSAVSLLGGTNRLVVNNTQDKYNFAHQTARFSMVALLRLSLVGLPHTIIDNCLTQTSNTGFGLTIDSAGRVSLIVGRGVLGSAAVSLTGTTALAANVVYVLAATCNGSTARLFIDGRPEPGTASVATLGSGNASFRLNLGGRDDGASPMRGSLMLAALWSRCLDAHELRHLAGDPLALLRRRFPSNCLPKISAAGGRMAAATTFLAGCRAGQHHRAGAVAGRTIH